MNVSATRKHFMVQKICRHDYKIKINALYVYVGHVQHFQSSHFVWNAGSHFLYG